MIPADSPAVGKSLRDLRWQARYGVAVAELTREGRRNRFPSATDVVYIGDVLLVEGEHEAVLRLTESDGLEFVAERRAAATWSTTTRPHFSNSLPDRLSRVRGALFGG